MPLCKSGVVAAGPTSHKQKLVLDKDAGYQNELKLRSSTSARHVSVVLVRVLIID